MSIGQIVDQGMQVWFTHLRCFIEEEGKGIAQGHQEGRMFILETNDVGTAMFTKGQKVESDIDVRSRQLPIALRDVDEEHPFRLAKI